MYIIASKIAWNTSDLHFLHRSKRRSHRVAKDRAWIFWERAQLGDFLGRAVACKRRWEQFCDTLRTANRDPVRHTSDTLPGTRTRSSYSGARHVAGTAKACFCASQELDLKTSPETAAKSLRTCAVCVMHNLVRRVLCRGTLPFAANVSCPCSAADSRIHDISSQGYKNGEDLDTVANNLGRPAQSLPLSKHIGHRQASIRRRS